MAEFKSGLRSILEASYFVLRGEVMPNFSFAQNYSEKYTNPYQQFQPRVLPWEMSFYDLLRRLVRGEFRTQEEKDGALALIQHLEDMGAFGSTVDRTRTKGGA